MSLLDTNRDITEESLKSIGFFRAAYDVDIEIAMHEYVQVPSYLKFIPLDDNKYSNGGFISIRYIPYLRELTINTNTVIMPTKEQVKIYKHIKDIDEINILVNQFIQNSFNGLKNNERDH